jgi:hypothetical protein
MTKTVKDLISYLECLNPNESVAYWLYTTEDVKRIENFAEGIPYTEGTPYTEELAERVINNLHYYDNIVDTIHDSIKSEISASIHSIRLHNTDPQLEVPSY